MDKNLENTLLTRLNERIQTGKVNREEIDKIEFLNTRLIPEGVVLEDRDSEELRALASLSRVHLKRPAEISSHRPIIGPLIVLFKKLTFPIVSFHMKDTIQALEEFAALSVVRQAKLSARIKELEG